MPIGKDSITKRVAKPVAALDKNGATAKKTTATKAVEAEKNIAPELVATSAAAPAKKAPAKKSTTSAAKKPAANTQKPAAKSAPKAEKKVDTAVFGNISPETVTAITGHEENSGFEKTQLGEKMPVHLL